MSMIIYTCPKCGADLEELVLTSYPPQYQKRCRKCGYEYIEQSELVRVPFVEPEIAKLNNVVIDLCSTQTYSTDYPTCIEYINSNNKK